MSTTVKYKGTTLATVSNQTKTLLTSGTWLEDDIELTDTGSGGGGATNFVQGTFTTNASSGVQNVTIPYSGTGYPIAAIIYPKDGLANSPVASAIKRYAIVQWSFTKILADTPPTYTTGDANYGLTLLCFKNSTSNATTYSQASSRQGNVFYTTDPTANQATVVKFSNATTLRFFVAASSYGLFPNTEYSYIIVYSS